MIPVSLVIIVNYVKITESAGVLRVLVRLFISPKTKRFDEKPNNKLHYSMNN